MHVLYIHQHFATPDHSIGTRSYELSKHLISAGHRVTMLCGDTAGNGNGKITKRIVRENVDGIDVIRIMQPYANSMGFIRRLFSFIGFALTASVCAFKEKPDLIYATSTPLTVGIPAVISQKKTRCPFVFEVRDLWPTLPVAMGVIKNPMLIWALRTLENYIYRRSDAIVTLAPGMADEIRKVSGSPESIEFIPNGCDTDLFRPAINKNLTNDSGNDRVFRLIYCGHHGIANGLDSLVDAASKLKERGKKNVKFVMIGKGSEKKRLMESSVAKKTEDYFDWLDPVPKVELAKLITSMDVGIMPLMNVKAFHNGTSPNKFFDYISAGLPVIINYPGWISDLIEASQCGVSVEPEMPDELASAIVQLSLLTIDERIAMGNRAREMAEISFARKTLGRNFVDFLEKQIYQ